MTSVPQQDVVKKPHSLLMIPGPIEFDNKVLSILSQPTLSHVSPVFIEEFGQALERTRTVLGSSKESGSQPLILSGSGTLGWEIGAANFLERGKKQNVLVLNTGYFSDSVVDCCSIYVDDAKENLKQIKAKQIGDSIDLKAIEENVRSLLDAGTIDIVFLTQVDTSTGVLNPIKEMIQTIKETINKYNKENNKEFKQPLFMVDGVCSFGAEVFDFDDFGVDFCLTASQKAFGCPPGLVVCLISKNAMNAYKSRTTPVASYFSSLTNWLPIMEAYEARKPSYFATPNTPLVRALNKSLELLLDNKQGEEARRQMKIVFDKHIQYATFFRKVCVDRFGLKSVADLKFAAHSLSAFYYPDGIDGPVLLKKMAEKGVIIAGGLHKDIKTRYFRIGHMSLSLLSEKDNHHLSTVLQALEDTLVELGSLKVEKRGENVTWFQQQIQQ